MSCGWPCRILAGSTYVEARSRSTAALPDEQRQQPSERDLEILRLLGEGRSFTEITAMGRVQNCTAATDQIQTGCGANRRSHKAFCRNGNWPSASVTGRFDSFRLHKVFLLGFRVDAAQFQAQGLVAERKDCDYRSCFLKAPIAR